MEKYYEFKRSYKYQILHFLDLLPPRVFNHTSKELYRLQFDHHVNDQNTKNSRDYDAYTHGGCKLRFYASVFGMIQSARFLF